MTSYLPNIQKALFDVTPDCIKIMSVDGDLLMVNRAGCAALNIPQDSEFGMSWLSLLPADAYQQGVEAIYNAAKGRSARFSAKSNSSGATRYWDNLLTPLAGKDGHISSILCVSRDITAKTQLESTLLNSITRERSLSREMRHRIKNLYSLVLGLVAMTEKEVGKGGAPTLGILRGKLGALTRASDVAFCRHTAATTMVKPI